MLYAAVVLLALLATATKRLLPYVTPNHVRSAGNVDCVQLAVTSAVYAATTPDPSADTATHLPAPYAIPCHASAVGKSPPAVHVAPPSSLYIVLTESEVIATHLPSPYAIDCQLPVPIVEAVHVAPPSNEYAATSAPTATMLDTTGTAVPSPAPIPVAINVVPMNPSAAPIAVHGVFVPTSTIVYVSPITKSPAVTGAVILPDASAYQVEEVGKASVNVDQVAPSDVTETSLVERAIAMNLPPAPIPAMSNSVIAPVTLLIEVTVITKSFAVVAPSKLVPRIVIVSNL